jgi:apolipoprotein N-acyltransferase
MRRYWVGIAAMRETRAHSRARHTESVRGLRWNGRTTAGLTRPRPHAAPLRMRWAIVCGVVSGLVGVLAFPRFGIWPLATVSVAGLSVAVDGRRARAGALLGLVYGLAFFVPLLQWTGTYVGPAPWLILASAEAMYLAGLGMLLATVQRLPAMPVWVGASWVLQEVLRDRWPFGGFPWGRLAFSQADSPMRWFAALGGAPLVTFAVALVGAALARVVLTASSWRSRESARGRAVALAPAAALAVGVLILSVALAWPLAPSSNPNGRTATVALVQGNVPGGLTFETRRRQVLDDHVAQTMQLAADVRAGRVPRPDLVVWPENSSDLDPYVDTDARQEIEQAVAAIPAPIFVGAILQGPGDHVRNAGILWSPTTGPGDSYIKRHPVPWGEYIPLRSLARLITNKVNLVQHDMAAGSGNGLVTGGPVPFGDVICFEVAYDGLVRSSVAAGAQLLVVQTNNATFGHSAETYQQLAMSQLRAVEYGRTTLQVSTTGVSAVIGADGRILDRSGALFTPARLVQTVPLHSAQTLATRLGAIPEYVLAAVALVGLATGMIMSRRAGRPGQPKPAAASSASEEMVRT